MTERFRVRKQNPLGGVFNIVYKADTTQECYEFLQKQNDLKEYQYYIEDLEDDIFVWSDEFIQAFKEGECPQDLQFF